jgi:hypothetical protein
MTDFDYSDLLDGVKDLKQAARDKSLAKLGDEIINFCFSLAKSVYHNKPTGDKVSAKILSEAMKITGLRSLAKLRAKAHDIADAGEALIAYAYLSGVISTEEITQKILVGLKNKKKTSEINEVKPMEVYIAGLVELFEFLKQKWIKNQKLSQ